MTAPRVESLPAGINFFTAPGEQGVTFAYVNYLRLLLGLRPGQSLAQAVAQLPLAVDALPADQRDRSAADHREAIAQENAQGGWMERYG